MNAKKHITKKKNNFLKEKKENYTNYNKQEIK